jgi:hypothetical protein
MARRDFALLVLLALASACSEEDDGKAASGQPIPDSGIACVPGELETDSGCRPAGLPPEMPPCPPGETVAEAGACVPAGVPPGACGDGFTPEDGGCVPILPLSPCERGTMAVPGSSTCQEVSACGGGTWGDIPVDATTEYVDGQYSGADSDGTSSKPWTSIQDGIDAATPGAIVAIAAGSYAENLVVSGNPVKLWGRCPAMVEIIGVSTTSSAVFVLGGADGSELRGVAVTGPSLGITVSGVRDAVLEAVWVHDTGERGINVEDTQGTTALAVRRTLVEDARFLGISNIGSSVTLDDSVVRRTSPIGSQIVGRGILIQASDDSTCQRRHPPLGHRGKPRVRRIGGRRRRDHRGLVGRRHTVLGRQRLRHRHRR